jgi:DNA-binding transcriptional MocR family regulator
MDKPNYYAVIPATVRYDDQLNLLSKMLYGEISALCEAQGHCWAGNQYFVDLYKVSRNSIVRAVNLLIERGYLVREVEKGSGNQRKLYISDTPGTRSSHPWVDPSTTSETPIIGINTTSLTQSLNTSKKNKRKEDQVTEEWLTSYSEQSGYPLNSLKRLRDELFDYCESKGKTYKDYCAALRQWARRREDEGKLKKSEEKKAYWSPGLGKDEIAAKEGR